jgi:membrane-bound lytic murein transglycosylase D
VADVAKRYRVSPAQVAQWNQVGAHAHFAAGSTVVVFVATRAARAAPTHSAAAGRTAAPSRKVASNKPAAKRATKAVKVAAAPGATAKR